MSSVPMLPGGRALCSKRECQGWCPTGHVRRQCALRASRWCYYTNAYALAGGTGCRYQHCACALLSGCPRPVPVVFSGLWRSVQSAKRGSTTLLENKAMCTAVQALTGWWGDAWPPCILHHHPDELGAYRAGRRPHFERKCQGDSV